MPNVEEWSGKIHEALERLEAEGFAVVREPQDAILPLDLRGLKPDFIGRRGADLVIVEVSTRGEARRARLDRLAEVVGRHEDWRLQLLWVGEDIPPVPSSDTVDRWVAIGREVAQISGDAALLSVWVAVEASLERAATRAGISDIRGPASRLISELYSLGVLSDRQYDDLTHGQKLRAAVAHGQLAAVSQGVVDRLASLAEWLGSQQFVSVDRMIEDFLAAYEDPVHHVPYISAEGGYQYIAGGPFDALDVLSDTYPTAPEVDLQDAAERLSAESDVWVNQGDY